MSAIHSISAFALSASLIVSTPLAAQKTAIPSHPSSLTYPALHWKIPLGSPYRDTLTNGLNLFIAEDRTLPLVSITGYIKTGTVLDPAGKEGLGSMATSLMRTGGTQQWKADTLDALIERLALSISFSLSRTQLSFQASFLSQFTDTALTILSQMLFKPAFEKNKIEQARAIVQQNIRHRFDNPEPILSTAYSKTMFPGQANSRIPTEASVAAITHDDIVHFWKSYVKTNAMLVAVSGNFNRDSMAVRLESLFPKTGNDTASVTFPAISTQPSVRCLIVHKPITQAYVRMGLPLFMRPHPDYYAVSIMNLVLGGAGFTSRLGTRIRSDEGLTYNIDSEAESSYFLPGTFNIDFFTKFSTLNQAITSTLEEVTKLREGGVTDGELADSKKILIDALPSSFRSPEDIVSTYAWSEYYGREPELYVKYPAAINALTKSDIAAVAQKYLKPDDFTFVVVGDTTELFKPDSGGAVFLKTLSPRMVVTPEAIPGLFGVEVKKR
jgi:zinc protease